jgi:hypothetical protein
MMQISIRNREQKLDNFFARAAKLSNDDELKSDLARFGAVLACGYIERCLEIIILDRISRKLPRKGSDRVLNFIKGHFKKGTNYNYEAILQLLERFDIQWNKKFREEMDKNDKLSSSLSSIYVLRNSVSHGGDGNRGLESIIEMYNDCKAIIQILVSATT